MTRHLTPREKQVLLLLAEGLTTREIASKLVVSFKTAACHRTRILAKLKVANTVLAVRWAIRDGLIDNDGRQTCPECQRRYQLKIWGAMAGKTAYQAIYLDGSLSPIKYIWELKQLPPPE